MSDKVSIAIMQPYVFPYFGYFQLVNAVDKFVFLDDVNFIKKGWINRNNILMNGTASLINVPVSKASQNELIMNLNVSEEGNWRGKLLTSLSHAYKKAPCYEERIELLKSVIDKANLSIADFSKHSVIAICKDLGIDTEFVHSSSIYPKETYGSERILDICIRNHATNYINPQGGVDLYDKEMFSLKGVDLKFLYMDENLQYKQFEKQEFTPNLSIIDVLMFNSNEQISVLLNQYKVK